MCTIKNAFINAKVALEAAACRMLGIASGIHGACNKTTVCKYYGDAVFVSPSHPRHMGMT